MLKKIRKVKSQETFSEGIVINDFFKPSSLQELEKKIGQGYHLIANHLDLVVVREKKMKSKIRGLVEGYIHMTHPTPSDYTRRKVLISSANKKIFRKITKK